MNTRSLAHGARIALAALTTTAAAATLGGVIVATMFGRAYLVASRDGCGRCRGDIRSTETEPG